MIVLARPIILALLLGGCASISPFGYGGYTGRGIDPYAAALYGVPDAVVVTRPPEIYTRAEIDAINAEVSCRRLARNMLEAQRCGVRR
jgi:hypothetical protein